jgi:ferredoxin
MEMTMVGHALHVDIIACDGHGICADLLPEWTHLDDWGSPVIRSEPIPPELLSKARWAVANCPVLALRLRTTAGSSADRPSGSAR